MPSLSYSKRALRYARAVTSGSIPVCLTVRLACERHLRDLEKAKSPAFAYKFSAEKGDRVCAFAERMMHTKGDWAKYDPDQPDRIFIHLEDWQCFLLAVAFGWINKKTGLRRFREVYWEIPRKNSKSTLGAIIGNYMLTADGEHGAEVYSGATSLDQAMKVFEPAWLMVLNNPDFQDHFGLSLGGTPENPGSIYRLATNSRFEPVIGDPGDGANPHCAIIDEYHEHASPNLYNTMKTGMGARRQPMLVVITTAGTNLSSACYDKHLQAVRVLKATADDGENDKLFAVIFGIDEGEDWKNFSIWPKANPNYGVSVYEDYLQTQQLDALQNAEQQNDNRTKHLNEWLGAGKTWMNMVSWSKQTNADLRIEQFAKKPCWLAFDLANKIDVASLVALFEYRDGFAVFAKHYLCEATVELPQNGHYRKWRTGRFLTVTAGGRTDFRRIGDDVSALAKNHAVQSLAYDPREASYLVSTIEEWAGFPCIEITQGPAMMNEPMKELEALVKDGNIWHDGDPVLSWMMSNVVKKEGRGGGPVKYYYPAKERDQNKIDGAVATIMAIGRASLRPAAQVPYTVTVI